MLHCSYFNLEENKPFSGDEFASLSSSDFSRSESDLETPHLSSEEEHSGEEGGITCPFVFLALAVALQVVVYVPTELQVVVCVNEEEAEVDEDASRFQ